MRPIIPDYRAEALRPLNPMINVGAITVHALAGAVNLLLAERVASPRTPRPSWTVTSGSVPYSSPRGVGIPAKSGVAGGLIGALPGQIGMATFSPRLDRHGNSVRGVSLFEPFSGGMGLRVMEVPAAARAVARSHHDVGSGPNALRVLRLQGGIGFAAAERVVQEAMAVPPSAVRVALDLTRVHSMDGAARRVLLEVVRRLTLSGHEVYLADPESIMPDPDPGDGGRVTVVDTVDQAVRPPRGGPAREAVGGGAGNHPTRRR
ncbi:glutaminase [Streptomyces sp. NPDC008317]|uniref:glutaminase n=1 Tax=Streptomyces sp. NPDC008317 TaxID=3364827 RepID=UPI0036E8FCE9